MDQIKQLPQPTEAAVLPVLANVNASDALPPAPSRHMVSRKESGYFCRRDLILFILLKFIFVGNKDNLLYHLD